MRKSILIIDDDNRNIFALSAILKTKGFDVRAAAGMEEAFKILNSNRVEFILIDMMMPDMDGYEGIAIIKSNERLENIPVIAVTAQAMKGDKEKCLAAGADDYVSKPVDIDQLLAILKAHKFENRVS
jgi:CheY-like chemotaxis protein